MVGVSFFLRLRYNRYESGRRKAYGHHRLHHHHHRVTGLCHD